MLPAPVPRESRAVLRANPLDIRTETPAVDYAQSRGIHGQHCAARPPSSGLTALNTTSLRCSENRWYLMTQEHIPMSPVAIPPGCSCCPLRGWSINVLMPQVSFADSRGRFATVWLRPAAVTDSHWPNRPARPVAALGAPVLLSSGSSCRRSFVQDVRVPGPVASTLYNPEK
jgi:hypothetical protein